MARDTNSETRTQRQSLYLDNRDSKWRHKKPDLGHGREDATMSRSGGHGRTSHSGVCSSNLSCRRSTIECQGCNPPSQQTSLPPTPLHARSLAIPLLADQIVKPEPEQSGIAAEPQCGTCPAYRRILPSVRKDSSATYIPSFDPKFPSHHCDDLCG